MSQPPALPSARLARLDGALLGKSRRRLVRILHDDGAALPSVDNELTSQLDGVYTLFGFVLDGCDELPKICTGDVITSMRCFDGKEKLQRPTFNPSYVRRRREASRTIRCSGSRMRARGVRWRRDPRERAADRVQSQEQGLRYVGPAKGEEERNASEPTLRRNR